MAEDSLAKRPKESLVKEVRRSRAEKRREKAQRGVKALFEAMASAAGGAGAGILDLHYPNIRGTGIPASVPAGVVVIAVGVSGYAGSGRNSELIVELGKGALAVAASRKAVELYQKKK